MPNRKLIVANWKMNKGLVQSQQFAEELKQYMDKHKGLEDEIVLCPPFTSLDAVNKKIAPIISPSLAVQDREQLVWEIGSDRL